MGDGDSDLGKVAVVVLQKGGFHTATTSSRKSKSSKSSSDIKTNNPNLKLKNKQGTCCFSLA